MQRSSSEPEVIDLSNRACAAALDRLALAPSPERLARTERPVGPDLVLRAARRDLLFREIDAWSVLAEARLRRWSRDEPEPRERRRAMVEPQQRMIPSPRRFRTAGFDLRVWVLHRAVGINQSLVAVATTPPVK